MNWWLKKQSIFSLQEYSQLKGESLKKRKKKEMVASNKCAVKESKVRITIARKGALMSTL